MMIDTESENRPPITPADLDQNSQNFWNGFTRFIVITTVGLVVTLLLIAAFTVWS